MESLQKKKFFAQFQLQDLAKIIRQQVKIKDLNIKFFYKFLLKIKLRYIFLRFANADY